MLQGFANILGVAGNGVLKPPFEFVGNSGLSYQLGPVVAHPLCKIVAAVAPVHPELSQPCKPTAHPLKHLLRPVAFRATCRGDNHSEHQPQRVHQNVALAPFDLLARVEADLAAVPVRLDALAVQDRGAGLVVAVLRCGAGRRAGRH